MPRSRRREKGVRRFAWSEIARIERVYGSDEGMADDEISRSLINARSIFSNDPVSLDIYRSALRRHAMRKGLPADIYETIAEKLGG